jgi:hypothetical protein
VRFPYSRPKGLVVDYESIKREVKIKPTYECRCDERLIYTPLRHWVGRGTGTPKDKDEVKNPSKPNQKILEPEPGLVLTLSNWYKTSSNLDVHLPEPGHFHFVQAHFTTEKIRPGSAEIFFSGT